MNVTLAKSLEIVPMSAKQTRTNLLMRYWRLFRWSRAIWIVGFMDRRACPATRSSAAF